MVSKTTERAKIAERMPWVRKLAKPVPCEGIKWNIVSMKMLHQIRQGDIPEKVKCKKLAHWHFTSLKNSTASSGNYCWSHLIYRGIFGSQEESNRTRKWFIRNLGDEEMF